MTVPRTSLTCFQRTFRSFLGGNCITFSQPLVSIYSLIACKIHATDSRSLSPPCETSGRNSDPLRTAISPLGRNKPFSGLLLTLPSTPANLSVYVHSYLAWRINIMYFFFFFSFLKEWRMLNYSLKTSISRLFFDVCVQKNLHHACKKF